MLSDWDGAWFVGDIVVVRLTVPAKLPMLFRVIVEVAWELRRRDRLAGFADAVQSYCRSCLGAAPQGQTRWIRGCCEVSSCEDCGLCIFWVWGGGAICDGDTGVTDAGGWRAASLVSDRGSARGRGNVVYRGEEQTGCRGSSDLLWSS